MTGVLGWSQIEDIILSIAKPHSNRINKSIFAVWLSTALVAVSILTVGRSSTEKGSRYIENNTIVDSQVNESSMNKLYQMGEIFGRGFAAGLQKNMPAALDMQGQNMIPWSLFQQDTLQLDNHIISNMLLPSLGDDTMTYKIKRAVEINGVKKTIYANTEQEYAQKLMIAMGLAPKVETDKPKHLLSEYCTNWFHTFAEPNVQTATAVQYQRAIDTKIIPHFGERYIEDITVEDVQGLFNSMDGLTKESKLKVKTPLLMIFDMAVENGLLARNPMHSKMLKINGAKSSETQPYTQEQMKFLVAHIGELETMQDRHYLAIQSMHPLRMEEVLGLQWRDIDLEHNTLTVRQVVTHPTRNQPEVKAPKTTTSARVLPLSPIAKRYLTVGSPEEYVVGGGSPLSYQLVKGMCRRIEKQTGFDDKVTPRRFRTTVLTDIYDQTKDIKLTQAMAGHSNSQMTLKHYVKGRMQTSQSDVVSKLYGAC